MPTPTSVNIPVGNPDLPAQANKPTEQEKMDNATKHVSKGKIMFGSVEHDVDITVETTPNTDGGYDTKVFLPMCPISAVKN